MSCAIISDLWFPVRQRTLATAVAVTGPPVGQALGFAVPALLTVSQRTQVQQLMCLEAFSCCFLFLAAWLHFPGAPGVPPSASCLRRTAHDTYARLLRPGAWRFWLLNLSFAVPVGIYQSWCSVLNLNLPHTTLSAQNVAVLGSMMTLSGAAGSIFIGLATRRLLGALKSILLLCALCSALGFFTFAKLLTSGEGAWALGASGVLGGFGLNCMPPLFFELIFESSYHLVSEHVASTCMLLSVSSMQILVLLVPVKIAGSSLWMNWLMLAAMVMCLCGLLPVRPRYDRLAADLGVDVACGCDRCGW